MKTKSIKELLELMLNNINLMNHQFGPFGLCALVTELFLINIITFEENKILKNYIKNNKPKNIYKLFNSTYYWIKGRKAPRVRWLKKHIRLN